MELRPQVGVFGLEPALFNRRVQLVEQLLELKRLGDETFSAQPRDFDGLADGAEASDDDGQDFRVAREGLVQYLPAVHARAAGGR